MIKRKWKLSKLPIEENFLNLLKRTHKKTYSTYHSLLWNIENFTPVTNINTKMPAIILLFTIVLEVLASAIKQEKEMKDICTGKEELWLSLFVDGQVMYWEYSQQSTD